jgi:integrase
MHLEHAHYASSTINLRLAAVRRLAYEAADAGLLSPDLAAGIRRVKGAKKHGVRIGNWLTAEQSKNLLAAFESSTIRGNRDYAIVAVLLGCGLRRAELATVSVHDLQQWEEHWVFADRQRRSCSDDSNPTMGRHCSPSVAGRRRDHHWTNLSSYQQSWPNSGARVYAQGCLGGR